VPRLNGVRSQVLAADRPIEHVAQQPDRSVDRCRCQLSTFEAIHHARLLEVRDEVLDVGRPDFANRPFAEDFEQGLEPIVDGVRKSKALGGASAVRSGSSVNSPGRDPVHAGYPSLGVRQAFGGTGIRRNVDTRSGREYARTVLYVNVHVHCTAEGEDGRS
jgi:hypothetical protein